MPRALSIPKIWLNTNAPEYKTVGKYVNKYPNKNRIEIILFNLESYLFSKNSGIVVIPIFKYLGKNQSASMDSAKHDVASQAIGPMLLLKLCPLWPINCSVDKFVSISEPAITIPDNWRPAKKYPSLVERSSSFVLKYEITPTKAVNAIKEITVNIFLSPCIQSIQTLNVFIRTISKTQYLIYHFLSQILLQDDAPVLTS